VISPMNWGGRTRTYNFLINSQPEAGKAQVSLGRVGGKHAPVTDDNTTARVRQWATSPRTYPRTGSPSLQGRPAALSSSLSLSSLSPRGECWG
jgi:hypothetical protein